MNPVDIVSTLQSLQMLKYWKGKHLVLKRQVIFNQSHFLFILAALYTDRLTLTCSRESLGPDRRMEIQRDEAWQWQDDRPRGTEMESTERDLMDICTWHSFTRTIVTVRGTSARLVSNMLGGEAIDQCFAYPAFLLNSQETGRFFFLKEQV